MARRILAVVVVEAVEHQLRAYDAVHLASALKIGADIFASADVDLCRAANRQGLNIFNPEMN